MKVFYCIKHDTKVFKEINFSKEGFRRMHPSDRTMFVTKDSPTSNPWLCSGNILYQWCTLKKFVSTGDQEGSQLFVAPNGLQSNLVGTDFLPKIWFRNAHLLLIRRQMQFLYEEILYKTRNVFMHQNCNSFMIMLEGICIIHWSLFACFAQRHNVCMSVRIISQGCQIVGNYREKVPCIYQLFFLSFWNRGAQLVIVWWGE